MSLYMQNVKAEFKGIKKIVLWAFEFWSLASLSKKKIDRKVQLNFHLKPFQFDYFFIVYMTVSASSISLTND